MSSLTEARSARSFLLLFNEPASEASLTLPGPRFPGSPHTGLRWQALGPTHDNSHVFGFAAPPPSLPPSLMAGTEMSLRARRLG